MKTLLTLLTLTLLGGACAAAEPAEWTDLMAPEVWKKYDARWVVTDEVTLDPANPKKLAAKPAEGGKIWVNGPGRVADLLTKRDYGDCEVGLEFLIAKGSNSGIKFHGLYEIQILDSFGKAELTGNDMGGIYPRARNSAPYTYLDKGVAPKTNAGKKPGEWNALTATWQAARFEGGKKLHDAKLVKATLNGQVIHENVDVKTPTGANWVKPETEAGPFQLQADHGPIAVRAMKIRPVAK